METVKMTVVDRVAGQWWEHGREMNKQSTEGFQGSKILCMILWGWIYVIMGFHGGPVAKNSLTCQCRRHRFNPWVRKVPWRKNGNLLQYSSLGYPMDRGAWQPMVHGVAKSQICICETNHQSRFNAWYRMLRSGALGWPRRMGWRGRWEGGSWWGTHVLPWRIQVKVWQNQYNVVK